MSLFLNEKFFIIGINYKNANESIRGDFNLNKTATINLLKDAQVQKINNLLVFSTCNRTEIYGSTPQADILKKLLYKYSKGKESRFKKLGYTKENLEATRHLFRVGVGLESQILGDFEVIGQLKKSFAYSKKYGVANGFLEHLINSVIKVSKKIKRETKISTGTTSVSFAATQYIIKKFTDLSNVNIVLFGGGKIGYNTCKNLIKNNRQNNITLINRTHKKAQKIAKELNIKIEKIQDLKKVIANTEVLIVATGATENTIKKEHITANKNLLILDLSIPSNVDKNIKDLNNVEWITLDKLSQIINQTFINRKKDIPLAEKFLMEEEQDFLEWMDNRKFSKTLENFKEQLLSAQIENFNTRRNKKIINNENPLEIANLLSQKITNKIAVFLKENPQKSEETLLLIQKIFKIKTPA